MDIREKEKLLELLDKVAYVSCTDEKIIKRIEAYNNDLVFTV